MAKIFPIMTLIVMALFNPLTYAEQNTVVDSKSEGKGECIVSKQASLEDLYYIYLSNQKDKYAAMSWSLVCPSLGHAYAGDWGRGVPFLAGKVAAVTTVVVAYTQIPFSQIPNKNVVMNGWLAVGGAIFLTMSIWEPYDVVQTVEEYNRELRKALHIAFEPQEGGAKINFKFSY